MSITWENIQNWEPTNLYEASAALTQDRQTLARLADDAAIARNNVQSSGESISAMTRRQISVDKTLDRLIAEVGELMMATTEAADGVWDVQTKVYECTSYLGGHPYLRINSDGSVSVDKSDAFGTTVEEAVQGVKDALTFDSVWERALPVGTAAQDVAAGSPGMTAINIAQSVSELQGLIQAALDRAVEVDEAYNKRLTAINDGTFNATEGSDSFAQGLPDLPEAGWSPSENAAWWNALTQQERDQIITEHPEAIGNLDGIDANSRDQANRNRLDEEIEAARASGDEERVRDLEAIQEIANQHPPGSEPKYSLLVLDTSGPEHVRTAIAVGDVDNADHVSTLAPGMGTNPARSLPDLVENAGNLRDEAQKHNNGEVATIAWIGYDAPAGLGEEGWQEVASTERAEAGADRLNSFTEGIHASRTVDGSPTPHQTVIGHSYGSTTAGLAVSEVKVGVVDSLGMFGSPGSGVDDVSEYNLPPGNVYVSAVDSNDVVQGIGLDSSFGRNPTNLPGVQHLSDDAPGPSSFIEHLNPIARHGADVYLDPGSGVIQDFGAVVAGVEP